MFVSSCRGNGVYCSSSSSLDRNPLPSLNEQNLGRKRLERLTQTTSRGRGRELGRPRFCSECGGGRRRHKIIIIFECTTINQQFRTGSSTSSSSNHSTDKDGVHLWCSAARLNDHVVQPSYTSPIKRGRRIWTGEGYI